jgi:uncharacterized tellurite resistance protein B-like protein
LGHALIAAAWADGELSPRELQSLKDLLFHLPGLRPEHWAELERRAEIPVDEVQRERLIENLRQSIASEEDRQLVLGAIDQLLRTDSDFREPERKAMQEIRRAIEANDTSVWHEMKRFLQIPLSLRVGASQRAELPEQRLKELNRAILREVSDRIAEDEQNPDLSERELRRLCLAGGLLAHVAEIDRRVDEGERGVMVEALRDGWGLNEAVARAVTEIVIIHSGDEFDLHRSLREFFTLTNEAERISFLDVLFAVAAGDGQVSFQEQEEIRLICMGLKLSNVHYIAAKTRIPQEKREV